MIGAVVIDTGPLVAALSPDEPQHAWVRKQLAEIRPPLLTCEAVLSETVFLLLKAGRGADKAVELVRRGALSVPFSIGSEAEAIEALLKRYADQPMSFADACLVRLIEKTPGARLLTFDGDFSVYRMHARQAIPTISMSLG